MPKPLIPVAGRPCVEYALRSLVKGGFESIIVTTGYLSDKLIRRVSDGRHVGASVVYSFEPEPAGTAGAVKAVSSFLDSPVVIMSGDTLMDVDIAAIYRDHIRSGAAVTMAVTAVQDPSEFGVVEPDSDGFVRRFQEKPRREEAFSNLVNAGVYVINREVIDIIPSQTQYDFAKQLFPLLLQKGMKIKTHRIEGIWLDIGRPQDLHLANLAIVDAEGKVQELPGCTVSGKMIMLQRPVYGNDVEFRGRCYIGRDVKLEDRNTIINSCLYDGVHIGSETRIAESMLLEDSRVGKNCDIVETILSPNCRVGDNVRLEKSVIGEGVFIKANSSLIGANISPQPRAHRSEH
ncbi:MAG: NDP-sugar synthase [Candidatus Thermoplasmatota archaeon]|nr:NDP-sugar synthase [Candidatus Thermoplasmatota archaeon]